MKNSNLLLTAAVASVLMPASHSMAQDALEEIIVTAERRATTEQTTAISMNVLTAEDLAANRTQNIADLQQTTPNVTINNPGGFNTINIRGIGNSAIQPSITTGVAVLQDGLLNAETITLGSQFLDLGTAEVLRGPQGTFIGSSSTGGAIRLNSVLPSLDGSTTGFVEAGLGKKSEVKVTGAVNLPISETFAARLAFNQAKRDGYFYSRGTVAGPAPANPLQKYGKVEDMAARISLLWQPNDSLQLIWRSETNRSDNEGSPGQPNPRTFLNANGVPTHSRYWNYDAPVDPAHDPDIISSNLMDSQFYSQFDRHSLEATYTFANDVAFRSMTGFQHAQVQYVEDQDSSSAVGQISRLDVGPDNNYYSQEFNLISPEGRFNWIVGTSWFYRMTPTRGATSLNYNCGISPATGAFTACPTGIFNNPIPTTFNVGNTETTVRTGGVFGQINWEFVDSLELTVGARYNVDRNFTGGTIRPQTGITVTPNPAPSFTGPRGNCPDDARSLTFWDQVNWANASCSFTGNRYEYEDETPTWKLGLNWNAGDNHFVYLFWARGYKSGGVDGGGNTFEPEQVDDYELGWKGTFADGRAQLSLSGFYMDYQDMQQQAFRAPAGSTATPGNSVFNVGSATVQGIEAEFNARLGGFTVQANVGWVDSELGDIRLIDRTSVPDSAVRAPGLNQDLPQCAAGVTQALVQNGCADWTPYYKVLSGERNVYSPELQYSLTVQYDFDAGNGTWTPRVGFNHTDESDINLIRREDFWRIDARDLYNASITYTQGDWLVQAYCTNCTDETYIGNIGTGGGLGNDSVVYGNPLVYGVRLRRGF